MAYTHVYTPIHPWWRVPRLGTNCRCTFKHGRQLIQDGTKVIFPFHWLNPNWAGMPHHSNDCLVLQCIINCRCYYYYYYHTWLLYLIILYRWLTIMRIHEMSAQWTRMTRRSVRDLLVLQRAEMSWNYRSSTRYLTHWGLRPKHM